jgi:hypothetical protein
MQAMGDLPGSNVMLRIEGYVHQPWGSRRTTRIARLNRARDGISSVPNG